MIIFGITLSYLIVGYLVSMILWLKLGYDAPYFDTPIPLLTVFIWPIMLPLMIIVYTLWQLKPMHKAIEANLRKILK